RWPWRAPRVRARRRPGPATATCSGNSGRGAPPCPARRGLWGKKLDKLGKRYGWRPTPKVTRESYKTAVNESETIKDTTDERRGRRQYPGPGAHRTELEVVRFENVGLRYGLGPEILRDLSFLIPAHSFQFLTGPSGAGKTSLLRLLFLSLRPTRGLVNLFGQDISLLGKEQIADLRKRIGIVLQDFRLLDHMTTYENVALPFRVMGRDESSYRREVIDLLKWVGLGERMDALPPILSGGEK